MNLKTNSNPDLNDPKKTNKFKRFWNKLFSTEDQDELEVGGVEVKVEATQAPTVSIDGFVAPNLSSTTALNEVNYVRVLDDSLSKLSAEIPFSQTESKIADNLATLKINRTEIIDAYETVNLRQQISDEISENVVGDDRLADSVVENKIPNVNTQGIVNHCYTISENPPSELVKSIFSIDDKYHNSSDDELFALEASIANRQQLLKQNFRDHLSKTTTPTASESPDANLVSVEFEEQTSIFDVASPGQYRKIAPDPQDTKVFDDNFFDAPNNIGVAPSQPEYEVSSYEANMDFTLLDNSIKNLIGKQHNAYSAYDVETFSFKGDNVPSKSFESQKIVVNADLKNIITWFYSQLLYPKQLQEIDLGLRRMESNLIKTVAHNPIAD